jgi:hypothetical protein
LQFAWQGFSLQHPEDWAPVSLSGSRGEGYARLSSSGRIGLQVRWKKANPPKHLESRLEPYFARLSRDAKRRHCPFHQESECKRGQVLYQYRGLVHGRGALLYSEPCQRVFFLEVTSESRNGSLKTALREILDSFRSDAGEHEDWSLFGLHVRLPQGLNLSRKSLLAGKTMLELSGAGARVHTARWGFAQQLIDRHGLEPWATSALNLKKATLTNGSDGIEFNQTGRFFSRYALVKPCLEQNQITVIDVRTRKDRWRPSWDWIP